MAIKKASTSRGHDIKALSALIRASTRITATANRLQFKIKCTSEFELTEAYKVLSNFPRANWIKKGVKAFAGATGTRGLSPLERQSFRRSHD
jgi:hypothetical protein